MWRGGGGYGIADNTVEPSILVSVVSEGFPRRSGEDVKGGGEGGGTGSLMNTVERTIWVSTRLLLGCCWVADRLLFCCSAGLVLRAPCWRQQRRLCGLVVGG